MITGWFTHNFTITKLVFTTWPHVISRLRNSNNIWKHGFGSQLPYEVHTTSATVLARMNADSICWSVLALNTLQIVTELLKPEMQGAKLLAWHSGFSALIALVLVLSTLKQLFHFTDRMLLHTLSLVSLNSLNGIVFTWRLQSVITVDSSGTMRPTVTHQKGRVGHMMCGRFSFLRLWINLVKNILKTRSVAASIAHGDFIQTCSRSTHNSDWVSRNAANNESRVERWQVF